MCFRPPSVDEGVGSPSAPLAARRILRGSDTCTKCGKPILKVPAAAMGRAGAPPVPDPKGTRSAQGAFGAEISKGSKVVNR